MNDPAGRFDFEFERGQTNLLNDLLDHISIASIVCQTKLYYHNIWAILYGQYSTAFEERRQDLAVYFKNSLLNPHVGPKWAVKLT